MVFVDAGVVGWRGRALVMIAPSGAATTELVTALVHAGASYVADRYAVLDTHGRVHPFPTPLRAADGTGDAARTRVIESREDRVGRGPLPVGAIVVFDRRPGARWRPRALTPGQTVLAVLSRAVSAAERPAFTLRVADAAVASAHTRLRGTIDDARDVVTALLTATEGRKHIQLGGPPHETSHSAGESDVARSRG